MSLYVWHDMGNNAGAKRKEHMGFLIDAVIICGWEAGCRVRTTLVEQSLNHLSYTGKRCYESSMHDVWNGVAIEYIQERILFYIADQNYSSN